MKIDFEPYVPEAWYREGLLMAGKQHQPPGPTAEKRASAWRVSVSPRGLAAGLLGISLFVGTATATNLPNMSGGVEVTVGESQRPDATLSPLRDINRSFNELFALFDAGKQLIPSEGIHRLTGAAVRKRNAAADVEGWAESLTRDVKDASD